NGILALLFRTGAEAEELRRRRAGGAGAARAAAAALVVLHLLEPERVARGLLVQADRVGGAREGAALVAQRARVAHLGAPDLPGALHVVDDVGAGDGAGALVGRRAVIGLRGGGADRASAQRFQAHVDLLLPDRGLARGAILLARRRAGRRLVGRARRALGAGFVERADAFLRLVLLLQADVDHGAVDRARLRLRGGGQSGERASGRRHHCKLHRRAPPEGACRYLSHK